MIPEDESVRLLSHELEELDYTLLYQAYSAKGRNNVQIGVDSEYIVAVDKKFLTG